MASKFLSTGDAAKVLGVDPTTVRMWDRTGKFPASERTESGRRLYTREAVEAMASFRRSSAGRLRQLLSGATIIEVDDGSE